MIIRRNMILTMPVYKRKMIEIRLLRNDCAAQDDVIRIRRRNDRTDFLLRYVDGSTPNVVWVNDKTRDQLLEYIRQTLYFAVHDIYPFKSVQVAITGCPVFVILQNGLTEYTINSVVRASQIWMDSPCSVFTE